MATQKIFRRLGMSWELTNVQHSPHKNKKLVATFTAPDGHTKNVHFGAKGYDDYTLTGNKEQRHLYRQRHLKDLKDDPTTAGFLAFFILWGDHTDITKNIRAYKKLFNL